MKLNNLKKNGICALCGKYGKLSFEHVPPQAAFNSSPIFVQNHVHLTDQTNPIYGKSMRNNRGSGSFTLCEDCNKNTGSWYVPEFNEFIHQGMAVLKQMKQGSQVINGVYHIKPLNVIKEILTMFLSIDKTGCLRSNSELTDFILNKEKKYIPTKYDVYLYSTVSTKGRMFGYSWIGGDTNGIQKWSEISFRPFGYFLTEDSTPPNRCMCEITGLGNFSYDQQVSVNLTTIYLKVDSFLIGKYG